MTESTGSASQVPADARTVAHSALWNVIGRAGPILIALVATPPLLHALGPSRWGVFTIALSLVGIFGIFDFGIGRALTRLVAELASEGEEERAASLVMTGLAVLGGLGSAGALVCLALAGSWVEQALRIPPALRGEVLHAVEILCLAAPLVIVNAALWGVIAAYQKFRIGNMINVPIMALYYVGPLLLLQVWDSLVGVMMVLVACRLAITFGSLWVCLQAMPALRRARPRMRDLRPLLRLGSWMTVSAVAWPLLTYMDRFVVASMLSAAAAGFYATPFDLVMRLSILTIAINTSAYPAIAASFRSNAAHTVRLAQRSLLAIMAAIFPACLLMVTFSHTLLSLWLGSAFAAQAAPVLRWLAIGMMASSIDGVSANLIDAVGRPDVNARLSLVEMIIAVPLLIALLRHFGIEGAAIAWALRCCADTAARLALAVRLYPALAVTLRSLGPTIVASVLLLVVPLVAGGAATRILAAPAVLGVFAAIALRSPAVRHEIAVVLPRLRDRMAPLLRRHPIGA